MTWLTGNWSDRRLIEMTPEWWASCELSLTYPGVYRLVGLKDDGTTAIIRHACGDDETGTLYIGASDNVGLRVGQLHKTHHPEFVSTPHKQLSRRLAEHFSPGKLAIAWRSDADPWIREKDLLQTYLDAFGELPPHNQR